MATSSLKSNISYHVRSTSFPSSSHPTALSVEAQLNKIQIRETSATPTAETICNGLPSLEDLYKSVDDLLNLPQTQQVLSHHQREKWVDDILYGSMKLLDICGSLRDLVSQIKEHVRDLQSALRRRKGDLSKDAKRLIPSLKQMESKTASSALQDLDHHVSAVIRVLREVSAVGISIFQSILLFVLVPVSKSKRKTQQSISHHQREKWVDGLLDGSVRLLDICDSMRDLVSQIKENVRGLQQLSKPKPSKWSMVSKLLNKGDVACENQLKNIEGLESSIEDIENGLEGVFRHLVGTRASLLNSISY
ncbi:hypothetical protein LguiA_005654 [Lonicera macranthoides]